MLPYQTAFTKYLPLVVIIGCFVLVLQFCGCGGGSVSAAEPDFSNDSASIISTAQLQQWWLEAQTTPIQLNHNTVLLNPATPPDDRPPDPRAMNIQPKNIEYQLMPDSIKGFPCSTVMILCNGQTTFRQNGGALVQVANSPFVDIHAVTVYEFQNVILYKLGYDLSGR